MSSLRAGPPGSRQISSRVEMGGWLYYLTNAYATQAWLARTAPDLSAGQIIKTVPLTPLLYPQNSIAVDLHAIGTLLYFDVLDGSTGRELWRSDGSAAGTF